MNYQRIVSLAPSITESIFALKADKLLVGVTDYCNYPQEATAIQSIGGFITPDLEKIKALKPDLVIATTTHNKEELKKIEAFGIDVKTVITNSIFDSPAAIKELGTWTGNETLSAKMADKLENELNNLLELVKKAQSIKKVYYLCSTGKFCAWKNTCTTTKLIELAGGKHIKLRSKQMVNSIAEENPDVIIIPYTNEKEEWKASMQFLTETKELHQVTAYKNKNIKSISGELLLRPGPRSAIGFRQLINAIHPELFE